MRIYPDDTAVLVIDFQEKLIPTMYNRIEFIHHTKILLKGLLELNVQPIVTQQYTKGLGQTVDEIRTIEGLPDAFDKITFSCVGDEDIYDALDKLNVKNIIVCGCEAHICVLQTVIDLLAEAYHVYLVTDCISARNPYDKEMAIERAKQEGAFLTTSEAILYELMARADTESFRKILKIVKG